jgi:hypothetical protein
MEKRDSEVEQRVLRTLKLDSAIACRELCVESQAGVVTLSGTTTTPEERQEVHDATRGTPGVRAVVNKIEVKTNRFFIPEQACSANATAAPLNVLVSTSSEASWAPLHAPVRDRTL